MRPWPKRLFRYLKSQLGPSLGWLVTTILSRTLRFRRINAEILNRVGSGEKPVIFAIWHGEQFIMYHLHRRLKIAALASTSADGNILAGVLKRFGYAVVRGSSSKGGVRALVELKRKIMEGYGTLFAVDGPRGPFHSIKPGVIFLAEKTGCDIVPVSGRAEHFWVVKRTWDQYQIPIPFSRAMVIYGDPIKVGGDIESDTQLLGQKLTELSRRVDEFFGQNG